jgi:hypothetical protein
VNLHTYISKEAAESQAKNKQLDRWVIHLHDANFFQGTYLRASPVVLRERMVKQHRYIVLTGEFSADECESSPGRSINLNGGAA